MQTIEQAIAEAEHKAIDSLGRYKFAMFGYHSADYVSELHCIALGV